MNWPNQNGAWNAGSTGPGEKPANRWIVGRLPGIIIGGERGGSGGVWLEAAEYNAECESPGMAIDSGSDSRENWRN